jgi:hypothetical protein
MLVSPARRMCGGGEADDRGNAESDALCFGVMGGPAHETLSLLPLDPGKSGLLDGFAPYIGSCAAVCLEKKSHRSGVQMAVEWDRQPDLPGISIAESVIDEVIDCLGLFIKGEEQALRQRIPDESYFANFVGLANAIAPDGDEVETIGFTALRRGQERTVALRPKQPTAPQAPAAPGAAEPGKSEATDMGTVTGELKFADSLEHRRDLIRLIDDRGAKHTVVVPPGMMTDIVRPLWGARVVVTGTIRRGRIHLPGIDRARD